MKFKRTVALLLAGVISAGMLAGCGGSNTDNSSGSTTTGGGNQNITLVMSQRDEWLSTMEEAATAAAKEAGLNMNAVDCLSDVSKAIQYVETARNAGEEAIIVNLVDPSQAGEVIEAAGNMKVVFVNRLPGDTSLLNENAVYVGSDETTSGKFQGEALAQYFKDQGKSDIKYILLNGIMGQASTINRTESVLKALADNGINATEATAPLACEYDRATAMDQISPLLTSGLQFDCIISNNDSMALGAIEAMENAGMDPSSVPIVGIDCTADGAKAVASGKMFMTVFQNAVGQGSGAVQAAVNMLNGAPINEGTDYELDDENQYIVWVPFEPVDASNVANYE